MDLLFWNKLPKFKEPVASITAKLENLINAPEFLEIHTRDASCLRVEDLVPSLQSMFEAILEELKQPVSYLLRTKTFLCCNRSRL